MFHFSYSNRPSVGSLQDSKVAPADCVYNRLGPVDLERRVLLGISQGLLSTDLLIIGLYFVTK